MLLKEVKHLVSKLKVMLCTTTMLLMTSGAVTAYAGTSDVQSANTNTQAYCTVSKSHGSDKFIRDMASIIGVDASSLKQQLKGGKSLVDVAKTRGIDETTLIAKIKAAQKQRLSDAVKAGKLTQAEANKRSEWFDNHAKQIVERKGMPPHGSRHHHMLKASAKAIGISHEELKAQLKSGKTILQVAQSKGISKNELTERLTANLKAKLDKRVAAGKMTAEEEKTVLSRCSQRIEMLITRQFKEQPHAKVS